MKNRKNIIKIFSLVALFAFSTSFVFAQVQYSEQLSSRLDSIINTFGDGKNRSAVRQAQKMYVYKGSKAANAEVIKGVQEFLVKEKYLAEKKSDGRSSIDGSFGRMSRDAIKAYQTKKGLKVDGIIGPATARAIQADFAKSQGTNYIKEVSQRISNSGAIAPVSNSGGIRNSPLSRDTSLDVAGSGGNDYFGGDVSKDGLSSKLLANDSIDYFKPNLGDGQIGYEAFEDKSFKVVDTSFSSFKDTILKGLENTRNKIADALGIGQKDRNLASFEEEMKGKNLDPDFIQKVKERVAANCANVGADPGCFESAKEDVRMENEAQAKIDKERRDKLMACYDLTGSFECTPEQIAESNQPKKDPGPSETGSIEPEPGESTGSGGNKENEEIEKQGGKITRKVVFACECDAKGQNCKNLERKVTFVEVRSELNSNTNKFFTENTISAKQGDDYLIEKEKLKKKGKEGSYYEQCTTADQNDVKEKKASKVGELIGQKAGDRESFTKDDDDAILFSDTNTTAATKAAAEALPAATAE